MEDHELLLICAREEGPNTAFFHLGNELATQLGGQGEAQTSFCIIKVMGADQYGPASKFPLFNQGFGKPGNRFIQVQITPPGLGRGLTARIFNDFPPILSLGKGRGGAEQQDYGEDKKEADSGKTGQTDVG